MCQLRKLAAVWPAASTLASPLIREKRIGDPREAVRVGRIDFQALIGVWFLDRPAVRK
jgi:hypothetical protein